MTHEEWLACTNLELMLEFALGRTTSRKLRLFACACCRHTSSFADAECRRLTEMGEGLLQIGWTRSEATLAEKAAEMAERFADGLVDLSELTAIFPLDFDDQRGAYADGPDVAWAAKASAYRARWLAEYCSPASRRECLVSSKPHRDREEALQCQLLRDVIGDPHHRVQVEPRWLIWNGGTVLETARTIYDLRQFDLLPVLADALEEAGCRDASILAHCRNPGPHTRGCWPVDLLLARE